MGSVEADDSVIPGFDPDLRVPKPVEPHTKDGGK